jgi:hypothetical protein
LLIKYFCRFPDILQVSVDHRRKYENEMEILAVTKSALDLMRISGVIREQSQEEKGGTGHDHEIGQNDQGASGTGKCSE